mgnify:CR=1 FL=1|tara:strand:- start:454 stop:1185 length:732 start_codon:yes stop_codon:yes gene_type:complete
MKHVKTNFLVVSDYNWLPKDLEESWVHKLSDNYLIYDRAHRFEETEKVKHQINVGQNIFDIFYFAYKNYNNLPDVTAFCRACLMFPKGREKPLSSGNCSEQHFLKIINNNFFTEIHDFGIEAHAPYAGSPIPASKMDHDGGFLEINNSWYMHHAPWRHFSNLNDFFKDVYVNPDINQYVRFSPGGNYIIPKDRLLRYSKKFYRKMMEYISWNRTGTAPAEAHLLERALYTMFTCDWEVTEKYK